MTMQTHRRSADARAARMDQAQRDSQRRLADKSFSTFMREHNRAAKPFEPNPRGL